MSGATDPAQAASADDNTPPPIIRKVANRIMWWLIALYFVAILDRGNVAYAAVPMSQALGLSTAMFGFGVGIMYLTYSLFEVPSNMMLARFGARLTLTRIAVLWGLCTTALAAVWSAESFYVLRAILGAAEAGLFPGVMLYLPFWFPVAYRARYNAMFNFAVPAAYIFGSVISGAILAMDGIAGIAGWRWLFLLEGLPAVLLGIACHFLLSDGPKDAKWLNADEKAWLEAQLTPAHPHSAGTFSALAKPEVWLLAMCNFGLFTGLLTVSVWLPQIFHAQGLGFGITGVLTAVPALGGIAGMYWFSRRSDRKKERFGHAAGAFLLAASGFVIAAYGTGSTTQTLIGFAVANAGVYATQAIFWTIPQSYLPRASAPVAIGMIAMLGSLGGAVAPLIIGWIKDETGGFFWGFVVNALVFCAAAALIYAIRGRFERR